MNNTPSIEDDNSQAMLNKLVLNYLQEQRRGRRWRNIKRLIILLIILFFFYQFFDYKLDEKKEKNLPHVGLIDINGAIVDTDGGSSDNLAKGLSAAYKNKSLKAVILRINSPGGSPVQADYMYNLLKYYQQKYPTIKTYAVCVDICASAAYYIAAGASEIYASPSSIVGSIGVIYNGFGFVDSIQKLGITRRLQTAGKNKGILDPFLPANSEQQQFLQKVLDEVHQQFIAKVKEGRGSRLKIDDEIFSGLFWTGEQAKLKGLIDGFASSGQLAREIIKLDKVINYTHKSTVFEQLSKNIGAAVANQLPVALGLEPGIRA